MYEVRQIINPATKESTHVATKSSIRLALDELKQQRSAHPGKEFYMTLSAITEVNDKELKEGMSQWLTTMKKP